MENPSARSLRLLALLQPGRTWTAAQLARHLEVAPRTVRRDIARLRSLGYDIRSSPGPGGSYRLAPGTRIPPLLLDADEVSSLVTSLLIWEAGSPDPTATAVRVKLEQLLSPTLRRRAAATAMATQILTPAAPPADWTLLGSVAEAIAEGHRLLFTYTDQHGRVTHRQVQPHRHVLRRGRWYLVTYDTDREDWRLFRLDAIRDLETRVAPLGEELPDFPAGSIEEWIGTDFGRQPGHGG